MSQRADDDGWLRALAGRPAGSDLQATSALEARLLRDALLRSAEAPAPAALPTAAEERDFQRRLARERAAADAACEGCAARGARLKAWLSGRWIPLAGAMASIAVAMVVVRWQMPAPAEPPVLRAPEASAVLLRAHAQPQQQRDELARRLTELGAQTRRYERLGRFGVDARFATPPATAVARELKALGLAADADGVVRVEFEVGTR